MRTDKGKIHENKNSLMTYQKNMVPKEDNTFLYVCIMSI